MGAGVFVSRRSVVNLIIAVCLVAVSCSDRESPTSPMSSSSAGKATISGTLLAASDGPAGGASGAGQPLANVTVRAVSTGQTAQTDAAGSFTLAGVPPGAVALEFRGAGIQSSATVFAAAGVTTRVTVTVSRGRSTVSLAPRSDDGTRTPSPTLTGTPATATPTRTPRPEEIELEGTVGGINGTSFVLMTRSGPVTIQTNPETLFRKDGNPATFADIATGGRAEVEGRRQSDGSVLASRVDIEEGEERTRTPSGTATATATATTPLPTRTPTPTRTPEPEEEIEREGTVGSISGTSFVLMTRSGPVTVQTTAATEFRRDDSPASFADITVGGEVEARGAFQMDGSLLASRVEIKGE
jgi:hypothetical protein